jgi:hypothetical protein
VIVDPALDLLSSTACAARRPGAGISSAAQQNLAVAVVTVQMAAGGGVLGAILGGLIGKSEKAAETGGVIGVLVGAAFGGFVGYEIKSGA